MLPRPRSGAAEAGGAFALFLLPSFELLHKRTRLCNNYKNHRPCAEKRDPVLFFLESA